MGVSPLARLAAQVAMDEHVADVMRLLLAAGANGRPALEAALHYENLPALEVLIAAGADASELLAAKLDFTQRRRMAADDAVLLLRAGARIEGLPPRLQQFGVELALRDRAERCVGWLHFVGPHDGQVGRGWLGDAKQVLTRACSAGRVVRTIVLCESCRRLHGSKQQWS